MINIFGILVSNNYIPGDPMCWNNKLLLHINNYIVVETMRNWIVVETI